MAIEDKDNTGLCDGLACEAEGVVRYFGFFFLEKAT